MNPIKSILRYVRDANTFRKIIKSWLGEGGRPVPAGVSQVRADQCLCCWFNSKTGCIGGEAVPISVSHIISAKTKLKLSVLGEHNLHSCKLCRCYLPLKIHVPIVHLRQFTPQAVIEDIKKHKPTCWQITERV